MQKARFFLTITLSLLFSSILCFSQEENITQADIIASIPEFSKRDRVLILAPHPDDEAIGTAGVIQRALKAGAKVKVMCFTNGDHNEFAFILYEKRLTFRRGEFIHMGEVRQKETVLAMKSLGLKEDDLIFLGYPDYGTMEILTKYWGAKKPFRGFLTRISKVPYATCLSPNAPYVGESILLDMKTVLMGFKPTKVFVSHPLDTNRDHRALYVFLKVSLWDLKRHIKMPKIFPYIIHVVGWPKPRGYRPELALDAPEQFKGAKIIWQKLGLTEDEVKVKHDTIAFYDSEIKAAPQYLFTFARKNELFGDFPVIKLKGKDQKEIKVNGLITPNDSEGKKEERDSYISGISYMLNDNDLFVKLVLKRNISESFGAYLFLLGYSKKIDFTKMPKIRLAIGREGLQIKNKTETLFIKDVYLKCEGKILTIKVPLSFLGNPDYILVSARTNVNNLPFDETAWRVLELD